MSNDHVRGGVDVPRSVERRWMRPREYARGVAIAELAGYWLFACGVEAIFRLAQHLPPGHLGARAIVGLVYFLGGVLATFLLARHASRRRKGEPAPAIIDVRDQVLSGIHPDRSLAYPTNFTALVAGGVFAIGFVLTLASSLGFGLSLWFGMSLWPLVVGSGVTAAVAFLIFLVTRPQVRLDLRWALDYEQPPPSDQVA